MKFWDINPQNKYHNNAVTPLIKYPREDTAYLSKRIKQESS